MKNKKSQENFCARRRQLFTASAGLASVAFLQKLGGISHILTTSGYAASPQAIPAVKQLAPQTLSIYNVHLGQRLSEIVFWENGAYVPEALLELNHLMRDHRTGEVHPIDPQLFTFLHKIVQCVDTKQDLHLISGYRSPRTNALLCQQSSGVAKKSQHMLGKAADFYIPGIPMQHLQKAARALAGGGVGLYKQFIHVDTGRVRFW